ncbi:MAG: vWA domain-containing protein [Myxococcota bacterium]
MESRSHHSLLALVGAVGLFACGRTAPVRYSTDGGDEVAERLPDGGVACVDGALSLLPARPVVMLVVDRSTSMNQTFPGSASSKWVALRQALHGALPPWNDALELGLQVFPSASAAACTVSTSPELSPAFQQVDAVLARLDALSPGGSTPTALGVENAGAALLGRRTAGSAKALILATDGAPDCNDTLDPRTCTCVSGANCTASRCLDDARTLGRISALAGSGVPTWIIGLRSSNDALFVDTLNRMADAGGRPRTGTQRFYAASSQQELETAFTDVRRQVGACHYLTTSVPNEGGSIELHLDGDFIPFDPTATRGWTWVDAGNGELALHGDACARAEALPLSALSVVVACAP